MGKIDYGKLAYQKTEELEARLFTSAKKSEGFLCESITRALTVSSAAVDYPLASFSAATGNCAVVIKLGLLNANKSNVASIYYDSKLVATQSFDISGARDLVILCSIKIDSSAIGTLKLKLDNTDCELSQAQVLVMGAEVVLARERLELDVALGVERMAIWFIESNVLYVKIENIDEIDNIDINQFEPIARAARAYVLHSGEDEFEIIFQDLAGNVFECAIDDFEKARLLGLENIIQAFAFGNRRLLFLRKAGRTYYCESVGDGQYTYERQLLEGTPIIDVACVQGTRPAVIASLGKNSIIKESEDQSIASLGLTLEGRCVLQ